MEPAANTSEDVGKGKVAPKEPPCSTQPAPNPTKKQRLKAMVEHKSEDVELRGD